MKNKYLIAIGFLIVVMFILFLCDKKTDLSALATDVKPSVYSEQIYRTFPDNFKEFLEEYPEFDIETYFTIRKNMESYNSFLVSYTLTNETDDFVYYWQCKDICVDGENAFVTHNRYPSDGEAVYLSPGDSVSADVLVYADIRVHSPNEWCEILKQGVITICAVKN
ncbi:MAG: hypothetical protein IJB86_00300 [Clostridia bacterium]|nr:hypothetical protein [Clostridia bacterium]